MKRAALIVIGDEILTGKVKDENSFVFANAMFNQGVKVERIDTIPDTTEIIADLVRNYSASYDYVATSGGVGPTHDDRTLDGIAKAFGVGLKESAQARQHFIAAQEKAGRGSAVSEAQRKMLAYPEGSVLHFVDPLWLPLIQCRNVFIFPGVPFLFGRLLEGCLPLFQGGTFYRELIFTDKSESKIAEDLSRVQEQFLEVNIGSYPQMPGKGFNVMVSIEGEEQHKVRSVAELLLPLIDGRREILGV